MATYQIETDNGTFEIEVEEAVQPKPQNAGIPFGGIAKEAASYLNPFQKSVQATTTPEARGVGQGAIQAGTLGYGMPLLRKAIPGSEQVPQPTLKEELTGAALTLPMAGAGFAGAAKAAGKLAPVLPTAIGYGANPSNSEIVPLKDSRRAIGAAMGTFGQAVGSTLQKAGGYINPEALQALRRAVKPGKWNKTFDTDAALAMPAIKQAGQEVQTIEDFVSATAQAKTKLWGKIQDIVDTAQSKTEYVQNLPSQSMAIPKKNYIDGNAVLNNMSKTVPEESKKLSPGMLEAIKTASTKYKNQRITIDEAEDRLQRVNAELTNYFKSSPRSGYVKGAQEDVAALLAERKVLRQTLYDKIQSLTGENIAPLKKQYGALMNIQDEALGRVNISNRQNPISLQEAVNGVFGITRAAAGDLTGLLQIGASQAVKKFNSSDYLIKKAVQNTGKKKWPLNRIIPTAGVLGTNALQE